MIPSYVYEKSESALLSGEFAFRRGKRSRKLRAKPAETQKVSTAFLKSQIKVRRNREYDEEPVKKLKRCSEEIQTNIISYECKIIGKEQKIQSCESAETQETLEAQET